MKNDVSLFDDSARNSPSLGCNGCILKEPCGGLHVEAPLFSCDQHCRCDSEQARSCQRACLRNPHMYVARQREVDGWELDLPTTKEQPLGALPSYVPIIKDGGKRRTPSSVGAVAVRMAQLFRRKDGAPRFADRAELAQRMKVSATADLFITGVGFDDYLERLWKSQARREAFSWIALLKPALVTSPNFSLFSNAVRSEDLYNMKRIAICWHEMLEAGIPTALHINARTDRDWERWREFIAAHEEVNAVSFEFGTGARQRPKWYLGHLMRLATDARQPLTLALRGGKPELPSLLGAFRQVVVISSNAFVPAMQRKMLFEDRGKLKKKHWEGDGAGWLDDLLDANIDAEKRHFQRIFFRHRRAKDAQLPV